MFKFSKFVEVAFNYTNAKGEHKHYEGVVEDVIAGGKSVVVKTDKGYKTLTIAGLEHGPVKS